MKWLIGAGFNTSAFPVWLTARDFSLLTVDAAEPEGPESLPPRRRSPPEMHRKQVKPLRLLDSMKVEEPPLLRRTPSTPIRCTWTTTSEELTSQVIRRLRFPHEMARSHPPPDTRLEAETGPDRARPCLNRRRPG